MIKKIDWVFVTMVFVIGGLLVAFVTPKDTHLIWSVLGAFASAAVAIVFEIRNAEI